ncbi:transport and Golgi organization protein 1 homolog isoform X3 [Pseudoliparis swirei]|uniref:transport and Golgi organization protein 1 homolog isoform X3 n=1 Tax=Pseudoliparis swirei TaxID=2059687 RepID=UPI0024BDD35F|nr:transport and Golgi organization protein 1 homolog isoform X3 [Pseudoliparis swirei]
MAVSLAHRILWATGYVFVILPHFSLGLLSDYKICGDSECESLMSRVQATRDHHGKDCRFLSFRRGETIFVYHKLAGKRGDLWAGTIDKQFGYFPKEAVREEQVYATAEKVVETQKSDFFCMDKFGYPIDSSHLDCDGDAEDDQKNQESETAHTTPYPDDTSAESPTTSEEPSAESPVSSLEAGGTSAEENESKSASDAAAGTHEGAGETPAARMEQGGSDPSPSSWLGASMTGWLGAAKDEEAASLAGGEGKDEITKTRAEASVASSVTGWLWFGREGTPDDALKSTEEDTKNTESLASTMTGWLGFGGGTAETAEKAQQEERKDVEEPAERFRSRRMSLDLEGSQLNEEKQKETGTLDWLGSGLSNTLGFGLTNQESGYEATPEREAKETIQEEEVPPASGTWLDMGIRAILGFKNDKKEVDENAGSGLKGTEEDKTGEHPTGSENEEVETETGNESKVEDTQKDPNVPLDVRVNAETNNNVIGPSESSEDRVSPATSEIDREDFSLQTEFEKTSQTEGEKYSMLNSSQEEEEENASDDRKKNESAKKKGKYHQMPKSLENEVNDREAGGEESKDVSGYIQDFLTQSSISSGSGEPAHSAETNVDSSDSRAMIDSTETEAPQGEIGQEGEAGFQEFGSSRSTDRKNETASEEDRRTFSTGEREPQMENSADQDSESPHMQQGATQSVGDAHEETVKETERESDENNLQPVQPETIEFGKETQTKEAGSKGEEKQEEIEQSKGEEKQEEIEQSKEEEKQEEIEQSKGEEKQEEIEQSKGEEKQEEIEQSKGEVKQKDVKEMKKEKKQEVKEIKEVGKQEEVEEVKEVGKHKEGKEVKEEEKQEEVEKILEIGKQEELKEIKVEGNQEEGYEIKKERKQEEVKEILEIGKQEELKEIKVEGNQEEGYEIKKERKQEEVEVIQEVWKQEEVKEMKEVGKQEEGKEVKEEGKQDEVEEILEIWKQEEVEEIKEERTQEKVEEMQEIEEIKEEGKQKEGKEIKDKGKQEEVEEIKEVWKQEDVKEMKEVKKQEEVEKIMEERKQEEVEKIKEEGKQVEVEVILEVGELEEVEEIMEEGKQDNVEKIKEEWKQQIDESIEERQEEGEELKEVKEREELKEVEGVKEQGEEKQAESHFEEEMKNNLRSLRHAEKDTDGPESDGKDTRDTNSSEPVFSKASTRTEESRPESPPTEDEEREEGKVRGEMKEEEFEEMEIVERLRRNRNEEETLKCSNDFYPQASVDGSVKNRDGNDPANILSSIEEEAMETGKQNYQILADRKGANQLVPIEGVEKDEDGVQVEEEKSNKGKNNYLPDSGDSVDPLTTENTEDDQLHSGEAHNSAVEDPEPMSNGVSAEKEAEQVPSDPETVTGEHSDQEEGESNPEHEADFRRDGAMAVPVSSVNLAVMSEQSAPSDGRRAGPSGGAFGLFQSAFSFFGSPLEETGGSQETPPSLGSDTFTVRGSLPSERALDSTTDPGQDVHTSPQVAETRTSDPGVRFHPADSPLQTKTPATHYKNLLAHMSADEATVLAELFGRHKLQFLDYMLGSAGPTSGDPHADGSILLDIERLLGHHREALMAPSARLADAPREDKEKTGALVALQKLETLLARVRETFSSAEASCVGESCSTHDEEEETPAEEDSSEGPDGTNTPRDEWTGLGEEKDGRPSGSAAKESVTEDQEREEEGKSSEGERMPPESAKPQRLEGVMRQIRDFAHQIAKNSAAHVHVTRERLTWLTVQVVSSLPEDIRPGPDLYGMSWEPVIVSSLVGLVTMLLFIWRCHSSVKSKMYHSKERRMAEQVAELLDEKCEVLETLSKCQQEYDDLESTLRDNGVLAQTQKSDHLEVQAKQLEHAKKELDGDLVLLKAELDQQRERRLEQDRRLVFLDESMKPSEEETRDLQSQEEQAQTTLKVYSMNSDRLERNLETAAEENALLQESNARLKQQVEGWAERVSELEEDMSRCEVAHSTMLQDVANKDERITSLTDRLLRMKAWDSDLEEEGGEEGGEKETSNGRAAANRKGDAAHAQGHLQNVQKLIYAAKLNADLKSVDEDKDRLFAKLNDEVKAKEDLLVSIKELDNKKISLQSDSEQYQDQVQKLQQKLQIMTEMYQENELKLHRLLTVEEKVRMQKEEKLTKADKNIALAVEELGNYRQRAGEMEEELEKTKQSYQTQISSHEKKAHNNWLAARGADRELTDIRRENALFRQKPFQQGTGAVIFLGFSLGEKQSFHLAEHRSLPPPG